MTALQLKAWRTKRKLSQEDLAERLGIHWITVSRWERKVIPVPKWVPVWLRTLEK